MKLISTQFLLLAIFIAVSVSLAAFAPLIERKLSFNTSDLPASMAESPVQTVKIGQAVLKIEIADNYESRARGLSGRTNLSADAGLLFLFDAPARYGFWMKDMKFPIDIIWIDEDGRVVYIAESVKPETFPEVFYPPSPASFVLEVNAGTVEKYGIKSGDQACQSDLLTIAELNVCA